MYKKGKGKEAKLSYIGNVLTENRNGFVVEAELRPVSGTVEREAAMAMKMLNPATPAIEDSASLPSKPAKRRHSELFSTAC